MSNAPTVGRIVHYQLSGSDAEQINRRRADAEKNRLQIQKDAAGYVAHIGNKAEAGQVYPMVIVRVWEVRDQSPRSVNGQVLLDGNDTFWRVSATLSDEPADGHWSWPVIAR